MTSLVASIMGVSVRQAFPSAIDVKRIPSLPVRVGLELAVSPTDWRGFCHRHREVSTDSRHGVAPLDSCDAPKLKSFDITGRSVRLRPAGWGHDSVHAQILHHLSVMIESVGDGECGQVEAWRGLPRTIASVNPVGPYCWRNSRPQAVRSVRHCALWRESIDRNCGAVCCPAWWFCPDQRRLVV